MKDDQIKSNTDETNLDPADNVDFSNKTPFEDIEVVEEFEDTDEEGKELGSLAKIKQLREKLKTAVEEKQQYLTGWQKEKAEFINIRRRDEESKQEFFKYANQGLLEELLPVLDSFDMAMSNKEAWSAVSDDWRAGMESIYGQFKGILAKEGVEAFGEIGNPADPAKFHMIGVDETDNAKLDHTVSVVLQKGYMFKEKVLRPAMVRVFHKA
jgi:molecular chaperone GrpE